jgi:capsular polysaccharide biosynthesis protein
MPTETPIADPLKPTAKEQVARMIFKGQHEAFVKRTATLEDNIQKTYSLVIGQCTDLLQSKLKQQAQWNTISLEQDAIALVSLIKTITFKFEDQKFLPLALYQSKANVCNLRQNNMSNHEHLQRFQNLVDVATSYDGQLHDQSIVDICTEKLHPGKTYRSLSEAQKLAAQTASSELHLPTMFVDQSDRRRFGKLSEELENSFTKGNDDYPDNLVSAYHLINEHEHCTPRSAAPDSSGVAFAQKSEKVMIITTRTRMTHGRKKPLAITVAKSDIFVLTVPHLGMQTIRNPTSTNRMLPPKTKRLKRKRKKPLSLNKPLKRIMKASLKVSSPTLGSVLL